MISQTFSKGRFARVGLFLFSILAVSPAHGRGLLVSPTQLGLVGKAGQTTTGTIYVSSSREEKNQVSVTIADFMRDESGAVVDAKGHSRSCMSWLDVDRASLESPEAGRVEVTVSARIPKEATGSYWAIVYLSSTPPPRSQTAPMSMRVVPRIGIPVVVTVEGTAKPKMKVIETKATHTDDGVDIYSILENTGNSASLVSGAFALERSTAKPAEPEEITSKDVGPYTSLPGTRLKIKHHIEFKGSLAGVQAHAYLRYGGGAEDSAEAAVAIEEASKK